MIEAILFLLMIAAAALITFGPWLGTIWAVEKIDGPAGGRLPTWAYGVIIGFAPPLIIVGLCMLLSQTL